MQVYVNSIYQERMNNMERISKLIKFPVDLVARIEEYQKENNIRTFSETVYQLIRKGLSS